MDERSERRRRRIEQQEEEEREDAVREPNWTRSSLGSARETDDEPTRTARQATKDGGACACVCATKTNRLERLELPDGGIWDSPPRALCAGSDTGAGQGRGEGSGWSDTSGAGPIGPADRARKRARAREKERTRGAGRGGASAEEGGKGESAPLPHRARDPSRLSFDELP